MRVCVVCVLRARVRVCAGLPMAHATVYCSTRLLCVGKDTYMYCCKQLSSSYIYTPEYFEVYLNGAYIYSVLPSIDRQGQFFAQIQALLKLSQLQALL